METSSCHEGGTSWHLNASTEVRDGDGKYDGGHGDGDRDGKGDEDKKLEKDRVKDSDEVREKHRDDLAIVDVDLVKCFGSLKWSAIREAWGAPVPILELSCRLCHQLRLPTTLATT